MIKTQRVSKALCTKILGEASFRTAKQEREGKVANKRTMIGPLILPERTIYRDKKKKKDNATAWNAEKNGHEYIVKKSKTKLYLNCQ